MKLDGYGVSAEFDGRILTLATNSLAARLALGATSRSIAVGDIVALAVSNPNALSVGILTVQNKQGISHFRWRSKRDNESVHGLYQQLLTASGADPSRKPSAPLARAGIGATDVGAADNDVPAGPLEAESERLERPRVMAPVAHRRDERAAEKTVKVEQKTAQRAQATRVATPFTISANFHDEQRRAIEAARLAAISGDTLEEVAATQAAVAGLLATYGMDYAKLVMSELDRLRKAGLLHTQKQLKAGAAGALAASEGDPIPGAESNGPSFSDGRGRIDASLRTAAERSARGDVAGEIAALTAASAIRMQIRADEDYRAAEITKLRSTGKIMRNTELIGTVTPIGAFERLARTERIGSMLDNRGDPIEIYTDRLIQSGRAHALDDYTSAAVEVTGRNKASNRGLFSNNEYASADNRIAEFRVSSTDWSLRVMVDPDKLANPRAMADRVNAIAARIGREKPPARTPKPEALATGVGSVIENLQRLQALKDAGVITEEEFAKLKADALA